MKRKNPNMPKINEDLDKYPVVIMEGIQTYLKAHTDMPDAYEHAKQFSRRVEYPTLEQIREYIRSLPVDDKVKEKLLTLEPRNYLGDLQY